MVAAEAQAERPADVVYIKDADEKLPLHRTTINGVEVYTVTDPAKVHDLRERFKRLVAPAEPRTPWYRRWRTWLF
jgi:hypothetical protein